MSAKYFKPLGRYTQIGELSGKVGHAIKRTLWPLVIALTLEYLYLLLIGRPGASAFAMIAIGSCIALGAWATSAVGLPLVPLLAVQNLIIYGIPIAVGHEVILTYPASFVVSAGAEVLVFDVAMVVAWKLGLQMFPFSASVSYVLHEFNKAGVKGWARLGFGLVACATGFQILSGLDLMNGFYALLPGGATSIVYALVAVVSACGFFLVSMLIGSREATFVDRLLFWGLLIANGMIAGVDFLLSAAAANIITVAVGFFWSNGRVPWRYLTVSMLVLSFLNTGKTTMRERYWGSDFEPARQVTLADLPATYLEWIEVSFSAVAENGAGEATAARQHVAQSNKNQTLLDRIDNLQNMLFVIDAVEAGHVRPLHGETYWLIPPLLVPRLLWPDKPRSHEGQVLLNVHFGRQDLNSTFATYIAWGLLPEAYGNFGAVAGSIYLGVFIGGLFAWIEKFTARKLVMSIEGFLSLSLLMNIMNSFEMVASVLVT